MFDGGCGEPDLEALNKLAYALREKGAGVLLIEQVKLFAVTG
jgi:hypothetical protein